MMRFLDVVVEAVAAGGFAEGVGISYQGVIGMRRSISSRVRPFAADQTGLLPAA
jgi:hypothetical protein